MSGIIESLGPALVTNFSIIFLGYIMGYNLTRFYEIFRIGSLGRSKIIPVELGAGLGRFCGVLALPALLFRSMATIQFDTIEISFLLGIFIAKSLVFTLVAGGTR